MRYYDSSETESLSALHAHRQGLSQAEAQARLERNGKNRLAQPKKDSLLKRFFGQLTNPMILVLLAAALISGILAACQGESFADVVIILAVVVINAVLGVYQERKAERAIEALQEMAAATSKVLRDGRAVTVPSEELVTGDVVVLEAGDAVPADGRLLESASLKIEEAALTGESVPVEKSTQALDSGDVPLGDRKNMVYMGSTVAYGRGTALVTATGMDTEMGKIAGALATAKEGQTPLQRRLSQLSKVLTWLVLGICGVIFAVQLLQAGSLTPQVTANAFMAAVSLAVAAIPEGLAAVVTVVLSMGVTHMSRRNAIIRRLTAVETLGCAQLICSDKTGTLTQNKMTVTEHFGPLEPTAWAMALCSDARLSGEEVLGEPTEAALVTWAAKNGLRKDALEATAPRIGEAPFDSGRKMMSTLHRGETAILQFTKGAPDEVLSRCAWALEEGRRVPMTPEKRREILNANKTMADKALRVLCAACRVWETLSEDLSPAHLEKDLIFLGLAGMIDPVRPEVKAAIARCREAGIRPVMITGDHVDTAVAIARELGILTPGKRALTGTELSAMDEAAFRRALPDICVYARVQPEHKTRIVKAWQATGCVTAMTGDGVNDAPSMKAADIGVGMGITGTDVTKNVADMVLADDNFATIVGAVEEGRRIYDNIRKAILFLLGSNMSEVVSIFAATLMGFTILEPAHLLWINLITDCFPALALGMETAEPDVMCRPPRDSRAGIFSGGLGFDAVYQGLAVSALTLASYFLGHYWESGLWEMTSSPHGMTMAFLTLSMAEILHSLNLRSQRGSIFRLRTRNKALGWAALAALLLTTLVIEVPFLANAFGFASIGLAEYASALGLALLMLPLVEGVKAIQRQVTARRK